MIITWHSRVHLGPLQTSGGCDRRRSCSLASVIEVIIIIIVAVIVVIIVPLLKSSKSETIVAPPEVEAGHVPVPQ